MIEYDDFQRDVQRRKALWKAKLLNHFPPGRTAGMRPRDPEKQRLLIERSRSLLERREREGETKAQEIPE